ncbi:MAG: hypothetical protein LIO74_04750 [Ruminococcus sp.]|nr:hypothetical protein [Ruminococcus sp.]
MALKSGSKMTNVLLVLLSVSVISTVAIIVYHFFDTSYETETAIRATANESKVFDGVYIRDESILKYSGSGAVSYLISDGGKAAVGDVIAEVYEDKSDIEVGQQIEALQQQLDILERISNVGTLEQAQPEDLSRQITEYYKDIVYSKDDSDFTVLEEAQQQFLEAYSTYQIVISDGAVSFADQISNLNTQISTLQAKQSDPIGTVTALDSCYFVSQTDGYESILTPDLLDDLTPMDLEEIIDACESDSSETNVDENAIGKTISEYDWYMVGMIDNSDLKYQVGDTVTLRIISSSAESTATIEALNTFSNTDEVMVVLYCENMSSDFVQNRVDHVEMVLGEYKGIKVPRDAIRVQSVEETIINEETGETTTEEVNARGVYVEDGEEIVFRCLDVIYEGDDYVLSSLNADDGYLMLYDSIIIEGIDAIGN